MTYLVTDNCIMCKHTDCVTVCPVDCFYEAGNFLAINPDECIDCGVCEPECPAMAIVADHTLPPGEREKWEEINRQACDGAPVITQKKDPMLGWEEWDHVSEKYERFGIIPLKVTE